MQELTSVPVALLYMHVLHITHTYLCLITTDLECCITIINIAFTQSDVFMHKGTYIRQHCIINNTSVISSEHQKNDTESAC